MYKNFQHFLHFLCQKSTFFIILPPCWFSDKHLFSALVISNYFKLSLIHVPNVASTFSICAYSTINIKICTRI